MRVTLLAAALVGLFLIEPLLAAGPPAPPQDWKEGYVVANGIRIHYWRTGGQKPALVLAHGSSDDGLCWTNFAKEFAGQFDIIMYDARGHGLSDPPMASDPPEAMAEDLAALIKELKLTKPIVMGHSMGSSATAWFATRHPDVPRAVILEDPNLAPRRGPLPGNPEERRAQILSRNNMSFDELFAGCMKGSPTWGESECGYWVPSKQRHHPFTVMGGANYRPSMPELLPKITAPLLIIKADAQGEAKTANEETTRLAPKGQIVHIKGAGHNVRREGKQDTFDAMKKFLAGL